jgi:nitrate/nitrite transport system substrate-binding protein
MTGFFEFEKGDKRDIPDSTCSSLPSHLPFYTTRRDLVPHPVRRWDRSRRPKSDGWYDEVARNVYRPTSTWSRAAMGTKASQMRPDSLG